jgi:hypothetical protein
MPADKADDPSDVQWTERDTREWVLFAYQPDQLTARLTCTYLETGGVEARVGTQNGRYCVEVPFEQYEDAFVVYTPPESAIVPPMQEAHSKTGIHTGRRLREQLKARDPEPERPPRKALKWLIRLAVIAAVTVVMLLLLSDS